MQKVNQLYVQTQFTTVGQGELLLMLYDGAIKFLAQAKEKMQNKDYAGKGRLISKALDVINELDASLNREAGGEVAENLHNLYFLCSSRLLQANLRMDPELIDSVTGILSGLRSAFAQIIHKPEAQAAAEQIAAKQARRGTAPRRAATVAPPSAPAFASGLRPSANAAYAQLNLQQPAAEPAAPQAAAAPVPPPAASGAPAAESVPPVPGKEPAAGTTETKEPAGLPLNLGTRRLAASALYGKMAGM